MKRAELEILETFDSLRRAAGHDYGVGQRHRELSRLRRELEGTAGDELSTAEELAAAFERVARPRIARIEREDYRRSTPATRRTLQTWERLERSFGQ